MPEIRRVCFRSRSCLVDIRLSGLRSARLLKRIVGPVSEVRCDRSYDYVAAPILRESPSMAGLSASLARGGKSALPRIGESGVVVARMLFSFFECGLLFQGGVCLQRFASRRPS